MLVKSQTSTMIYVFIFLWFFGEAYYAFICWVLLHGSKEQILV